VRRFHSYGPVDCERHFCVPRRDLVEACARHLVDDPEKGGHSFTVWAPRQTGKTWLACEVEKEIQARYPDRFRVATMSMQSLVMEEEPEAAFLRQASFLFERFLGIEVEAFSSWSQWLGMFLRDRGFFDRPLVLFMDEFDILPPRVIDRLVSLFRDLYLNRQGTVLHGLALVGVSAVLGVASERGSPFNVQRSLRVPNFTREEVEDLFDQYRRESGQIVEPSVVEAVHDASRGWCAGSGSCSPRSTIPAGGRPSARELGRPSTARR